CSKCLPRGGVTWRPSWTARKHCGTRGPRPIVRVRELDLPRRTRRARHEIARSVASDQANLCEEPGRLQRHRLPPQSSSSSRFTAGASAFFILSKSGERQGTESGAGG